MKRRSKLEGYRKLGFAIILTLISTIALFVAIATFEQWAEFQKWIYSAYALTNVGEYFGKRAGVDVRVNKTISDEE